MRLDWNIIIPALLVLAGTGGVGWFTVRSTNTKTAADTEGVIVESAQRVVAMQDGSIDRLTAECAALRADVIELRRRLDESDRARHAIVRHVAVLEQVITTMGGTIPPRPF